MSALDKIKKAIAPSETSELAAASAEQATERSNLNQLCELRDQFERELAEAKRPLGKLSRDGSAEGRKAYDAALNKVERLERELRRNADAQTDVRETLKRINARITDLTEAERIRKLARQSSKREKKAAELQDCAVAFVHAYQAYWNATEEIILDWPQVADSIGLSLDTVPQSIAVELYRLWPVGPGHRNAASAVPGAHSGLGLDDPRRLPVLADIVRQQGEAAVRKFKASVTPVVEVAPPLSVTTSADEVMAERAKQPRVDAEPAPSAGPFLNALEIQAAMPKPKGVTFDYRTSKGADHD
jgi:hypothetical protein